MINIEQPRSKNGLDSIVKEYLTVRGYMETVQAFEKESSVKQSDSIQQQQQIEPKKNISMKMLSAIAEDLFIMGIKEGCNDYYKNALHRYKR